MKPKLKAPGTKRLTLKCDEPLSSFAFKFNLRRYSEASGRLVSRVTGEGYRSQVTGREGNSLGLGFVSEVIGAWGGMAERWDAVVEPAGVVAAVNYAARRHGELLAAQLARGVRRHGDGEPLALPIRDKSRLRSLLLGWRRMGAMCEYGRSTSALGRAFLSFGQLAPTRSDPLYFKKLRGKSRETYVTNLGV